MDDIHARIDQMAARLALLERQVEALAGQTLPAESLWRGQPALRPDRQPATAACTGSRACRQADFETPWFSYWAEALGAHPAYHRKLWEVVYICQALHERGLLTEGRRGLGFGVGREPLAALFAARGCQITATDQAPEAAAETGWADSGQHAVGKRALERPDICAIDRFEQAVTFRPVDMNAVPDDLTGYDFCWSACALEHLGSLRAGEDFIARSLETRRPGGVAVHTTELNLTSDTDTLASGGTVLYRRCDLETLAERLTRAGHTVAPLNLAAEEGPIDRYIDIPPYRNDPHLRLAVAGYVTTSVGLIITRSR